MEITIIAIVLLLWLVLGGIAAILVCPLLKLEDEHTSPSPSLGEPPNASFPERHPNPIVHRG